MTNVEIGLLTIAGMLVLIQTGMHVAIALLLLSFVGVWAMKDNWVIAGNLVQLAAYEGIKYYSFGVIPLFVVMGLLVGISDIGRDTFDVANQCFRRVRGGVGMSTVAANAAFAAVNGTSIASASVFTRIAVPELIRLGYTPRFSVGVVAGSSVLGMLIPPSLLLILFGIIAEVSIGDLFTAGIIPGLFLSAAFAVTIYVLTRLWPAFVGLAAARGQTEVKVDRFPVLVMKMIPIVVLILVVLGGIYGGIFTPTEAGAVGALGALALALLKRRLDWNGLWSVLSETGYVTAAIAFLLIAAHMYANMLALSGLPNVIGDWIEGAGLGLYGILAIYILIVVLLGTILDSASIMLVLLPLIIPVMTGLDVDLVWFGIVTIIAVEIGLLTPPLGIACFVIKSNLQDERITLGDIFAGAAPFAFTMLLVLIVVAAVPWLSLALL